MRLINVRTLQLTNFESDSIPAYAILSHRWTAGEVTFQDVTHGNAVNKAGYSKIQQTAERALSQGIPFVWVDTCCIDKSSSAELSEAINSMYKWYHDASICYAYLEDVLGDASSAWTKQHTNSVWNSLWFTRGWTLQELLAPWHIEFLSKDWEFLGTKKAKSSFLSEMTGVDENVLHGRKRLSDVSVARRMSWAAKRATKRVEDMAYCLMGVFGVNMALLYGERANAFTRLQEEILRTSNDRSLFAWTPSELHQGRLRSVLAASPAEFLNSAGIRFVAPRTLPSETLSYMTTNMGLQIRMAIAREFTNANVTEFDNHYGTVSAFALLDCYAEGDPRPMAITLAQVSNSNGQYFRVVYDRQPPHANITCIPLGAAFPDRETIFLGLRAPPRIQGVRDASDHRDITFFLVGALDGLIIEEVYPEHGWSAADRSMAISFSLDYGSKRDLQEGKIGFLFVAPNKQRLALFGGVGRRRNDVWRHSWRSGPWCKLVQLTVEDSFAHAVRSQPVEDASVAEAVIDAGEGYRLITSTVAPVIGNNLPGTDYDSIIKSSPTRRFASSAYLIHINQAIALGPM